MRGALKPGSVRRLCKASLAHDPEPLALFAEKNGLSPDVLDMVIAQTVKTLWPAQRTALPEAPFDPARKTCPYCGGKPELSVVHEKEGHRSLFCTDCGRHWRFQRTACPSCGCDKPDNLRLHFAENTPDERAVSCKNCGHYILEADIRKRDLALDGAASCASAWAIWTLSCRSRGSYPLGNLHSAKMVAQKKAASSRLFCGMENGDQPPR